MEVSEGNQINQSTSLSPTDYSSGGTEGGGGISQSVTLDQIVPEDYKGAAYLESVKDIDGLFNQFHNLQKKLGERAEGLPGADAGEEEWNKLYNKLGRPEKPDAYEFEKLDGLEYSDDQLSKVKDMFHKAGLNSKQAKMIQSEFDKMQLDMLQSSNQEREQADLEFENATTKLFGDRKDQALQGAKELLEKYTPEGFGDKIANLDNNSLVAMASVLDGIRKEYMSEDSLNRGGGAPITKGDSREQAIKLMQSDAWKNPFHKDHESVKQQVADLYRKV